MDEYFLQYLWRFQKLTPPLRLTNGQLLKVFSPGIQNHDSGPDFQEARIKIDTIRWSGSVEIHYKSSDWKRHHHHSDRAYNNVVLHAVWIHDEEILIDGNPLPTLVLSGHTPDVLDTEYRRYINLPSEIKCGQSLEKIAPIEISSMLDKAVALRLKQKADRIKRILIETSNDWEETAYRVIAAQFGFKINTLQFIQLANSLPFSILRKYNKHPFQVQALVFGMAGFLYGEDPFQKELKKEFDFLRQKHMLNPVLDRHHWKNGKMRPSNFPSVRLAQFAAFISATPQLFVNLVEVTGLIGAKKFFTAKLHDYWLTHFDFGKGTTRPIHLGNSSIELLMVNTLVPLLVAYSKFTDELNYLDQARHLLEELPAENNRLIKKWQQIGVIPQNAADSQALIFQLNEFCLKKRCLQCNIGVSLLHHHVVHAI